MGTTHILVAGVEITVHLEIQGDLLNANDMHYNSVHQDCRHLLKL